jgi:hypothetical protein
MNRLTDRHVVVVVDDEPSVLSAIRRSLRNEPYPGADDGASRSGPAMGGVTRRQRRDLRPADALDDWNGAPESGGRGLSSHGTNHPDGLHDDHDSGARTPRGHRFHHRQTLGRQAAQAPDPEFSFRAGAGATVGVGRAAGGPGGVSWYQSKSRRQASGKPG